MSARNPAKGSVVLLHGFGGLPGVMHPFSLALRRAGYRTFAPWYDSWRLPMRGIVDRLAGLVAAFEQDGAAGEVVHFIGHSMGGLVARMLIARRRPEHLGRVVMLGTPSKGSELADLIHRWPATRAVLGQAAPALVTMRDPGFDAALGLVDYPLGIIAGDRPMMRGISDQILPRPHDGKVSVASTHVPGETDHLVLPLSHMMLGYHPSAHAQAEAFLKSGRFKRDGS